MPSIFTYLSNRLCDHFFTLSNFIISRKEESVTFSKVSSALGHRCRRHDTLIGVQLAAKMTAFLAFGKAFSNLINNLTALIATVSSSLLDHFIAHFVLQLLLLVKFGSVRKGVHVTLCLLAQLVDRVSQELIRWANGQVRLIGVILPGKLTAIVSLFLHHLAFWDHLTRQHCSVRELVDGEHLLTLGLLGNRHS